MKKVYKTGINNAGYPITWRENGKRKWCPYYRRWSGVLQRCYSPVFQQKWPTYVGCRVCDEWLYFANFKTWMETENWKNKQIDKDILGDGKLYSPETCCFVEPWLNSLWNDCRASKGTYPTGVYKLDSKFRAMVSGKGRIDLGLFDTPEEAHRAYCQAKFDCISQKVDSYPDQRIREAVLRKAYVLYCIW